MFTQSALIFLPNWNLFPNSVKYATNCQSQNFSPFCQKNWPFLAEFGQICQQKYGKKFLGQKRSIFGIKIFGFTNVWAKRVPFLGSKFWKFSLGFSRSFIAKESLTKGKNIQTIGPPFAISKQAQLPKQPQFRWDKGGGNSTDYWPTSRSYPALPRKQNKCRPINRCAGCRQEWAGKTN